MKKFYFLLLMCFGALTAFSREDAVTISTPGIFACGQSVWAKGVYTPPNSAAQADHYTWTLTPCDDDGQPLSTPFYSETFPGEPQGEFYFPGSEAIADDQLYMISLDVTDVTGEVYAAKANIPITNQFTFVVNSACSGFQGANVSVTGYFPNNMAPFPVSCIWSITICDQFGATTGPTVHTSSPQPYPGSYNFAPNMAQIGYNYIRIDAAVLLQLGNVQYYSMLSKVKFIGYPNPLFANVTNCGGYGCLNICNPNGTTVCVTGLHMDETVNSWTSGNTTLQNGGNCLFLPYGTSGQVQVNVTNACGQTGMWWMAVNTYDSDPNFSLNTNYTPNAPTFTYACTPTVNTPASATSWYIEETQSTAPYTAIPNTGVTYNQFTLNGTLNSTKTYRLIRTVSIADCSVTTKSKVFDKTGTICTNCREGYAGDPADGEESSGLSVMPNPNNGSFTVQLATPAENAQAELYSVLGERVDAFTFSGATYNYSPAQTLAPGVYLLRVTTNGAVSDQRVVIR